MTRYDEIRARWRRSGADRGWDNTTDCFCPDEPHQNALHVLADEDVPWLLDRIDAVRKLHRPEKRWHDGSGEWSVDTPEETDVDDPEYFEICTHCGGLEVNDQAPLVQYRDSLWPCATRRVLDGGEDRE